MRKPTWIEILAIYQRTPPFILGTLPMVMGVIATVSHLVTLQFNSWGLAIGAGFFLIGYLINRKKWRMAKWALRVSKDGIPGTATISKITNTGMEHNSRRVKQYRFSYTYANQTFEFEYNSAYHRFLNLNDTHKIFFLPDEPKVVFVPILYFKDENRFDL